MAVTGEQEATVWCEIQVPDAFQSPAASPPDEWSRFTWWLVTQLALSTSHLFLFVLIFFFEITSHYVALPVLALPL